MEELKPCPFCGGEAEIDINDIQKPDMFWRYAVGCSFFGCIAYSRFSTHFHTKEEAIAAWNTRAEQTCVVTPDGYGNGVCSNCQEELEIYDGWSPIDNEFLNLYCPNCGAKVVS